MSIGPGQSPLALAVIDAGDIRLAESPMRIPLPNERMAKAPSVELVRDGDAVVGAIVTCSCGERLRLRFEF